MSRTHPYRIAVSVFIFVLAIAGALMVLSHSTSDSSAKSGSGNAGGTSIGSKVWKRGTAWTVSVAQDGATVSPDSTRSVSNVAYRFRVEGAPKTAGGEWKVFASQDGAEGQFADGWHLGYVADAKGCMTLAHVSQGKAREMDADVASIVLGVGFPYQVTYCSTPAKSATVPQSKLLSQSALPPSLPSGGGDSGVTPPGNAPSVGAGELPPGVPTAMAPAT
jgi:hypothetical protein